MIPLAILYDNYGYLLIDTVNGVAAAIDPSDPVVVKVYVSDILFILIIEASGNCTVQL